MKYLVSIVATVVIKDVMIDVDGWNQKKMAEKAAEKWIGSLRGECSASTEISDELLSTWDLQD